MGLMVAVLTAYIISIIWIRLSKVKKIKDNKFIRSMVTAVGIILLCEIFIFNASVFRTAFSQSPRYRPTLRNAKTTNMINTGDKLYALNAGECTIEFPSIGCPVETIHFNISSSKNISDKKIAVSFSDSTGEALRDDLCTIHYIANNEQTEYVACSFSDDVQKLKFSFTLKTDEQITISSIGINEEIPFNFSLARIFSLMLLVLPIVAVMNCKKRDQVVDLSFFKRVCIATAAVFAVIPILIGFCQSPSIVNDFQNPQRNQINYELVNSFKAGKLTLEQAPDERIAELDNPYDKSQHADIPIAWDHVYYNGNYYSYYGIGPVLLLFLPYNLITGNYFPSLWACCIFAMIGIIFLAMTYFSFIKRYFPNISNAIAIFGLFITEITSGIWFSTAIDNFYEIAQSSAFAAITAGAYFLVESNAVGAGKTSLRHACISSILLSLAVMCRPTTAVYCIAALVFIFFGAKKLWRKKNELIKYLCSALIPFVVIGSIQMLYNALRFGSPFEFGIQYSLTINDFTQAQFHWTFVFISLYNYLFAVPKILPSSPFVFENFSLLDVNGYYFNNSILSIGLPFTALPVFGYAFVGKAWRYGGKNKKAMVLTLAACVIAPLIIIFSIWESGYSTRYVADFNWQLLFGAYVILFTIYTASTSKTTKKLMTIFFSISSVVALITVTSSMLKYISTGNAFRETEFTSFVMLFDIFKTF